MAKLIYLKKGEPSQKTYKRHKTSFYKKIAYSSIALNIVLLLKLILNNLI